MQDVGKGIIFVGLLLILFGLLLLLSNKIPFVGKLPGDVFVKKDGFIFYFPITTSILVSIILSLLIGIFSNFKK
jgi:hypothetical protein